MYVVDEAVAVNRDRPDDAPELTQQQVWDGLLMKANNALPFVPRMTRCDVVETFPDGLVRDVTYRGEELRERVTFDPPTAVTFDRIAGSTTGSIRNQIERDTDGELVLRFKFSLRREGIDEGSAAEREYFAPMEGDYRAAVAATLSAIRRVAGEAEAKPV
jgi:hypothetical protein